MPSHLRTADGYAFGPESPQMRVYDPPQNISYSDSIVFWYNGSGMRALSKSFAAVIIVAALFWGNCFSCPQLLLTLTAKAPHGCCKRSAPVARTCTTSVLKHFVKADPVQV